MVRYIERKRFKLIVKWEVMLYSYRKNDAGTRTRLFFKQMQDLIQQLIYVVYKKEQLSNYEFI